MSIRKLYFQNSAGERWGLNGERGAYATALAGFGYALADTFADLGSGFFAPVADDKEPQNNLAFTVVLTHNPYTSHQALMDWLAAAGKLTIVYDPTGRQEYFRDISVKYLEKGELNAVGWLELLCGFSCHTPWYLPTPTSLGVAASGKDESIRYPYRYSPDLRYGTDGTAGLRALIAGTGHIPGALQLSFRGAVTNPRIRLVGNSSGMTYGLCRLDVILDETDTLEYSSRYEDSFVRRIRPNGTQEDLLNSLDLSSEPFFRIPVSEPCTLTVEADAPFAARANLLIYYYFRSV